MGMALIRDIAKKRCSDATFVAHFNSSDNRINGIRKEFPGIRLVTIKADMSDVDDVNHMIAKIKEMKLEPDYIVDFCAMPFAYTRMTQWDTDFVSKDMTIQVFSFAEVLKAFLPHMAENHFGKIVALLTSYTFGIPPKNMAGYVTVKYALLGLIKSVAADYGNQGININGISPGMVETKFLNNVGRKAREFSAEGNPRHRNLTVDDVVPTISHLLSEDSDFINGANINLSATPG